MAGEVACVISGRWATSPHPMAEGGRGYVCRFSPVRETLGSGQLGLSGHRGSRGVGIRGVSSKRAQAPLRFPIEPPGGVRQAWGSSCFFCGIQYRLESFRRSDALFWPLRVPGEAYMIRTYIPGVRTIHTESQLSSRRWHEPEDDLEHLILGFGVLGLQI